MLIQKQVNLITLTDGEALKNLDFHLKNADIFHHIKTKDLRVEYLIAVHLQEETDIAPAAAVVYKVFVGEKDVERGREILRELNLL